VGDVRYALQILGGPYGDGEGFGYGINDGETVVGVVSMPVYPAAEIAPGGPAIWPLFYPQMPTVPFFPDWPTGGELLAVSDFYAVGQVDDGSPDPFSAVVDLNGQLIVDLRSLGNVLPSDINNRATVTGTDPPNNGFGSQAFIYTFLPIPGNQIWLSPLPNSTGILASGINDLGDVVGGCDNNAGFFYSASTQQMTGIDSCFLNDINVNRLAVGQSVSGQFFNDDQPVMVDLSKATPVLQTITPPEPFVGAVARAVNSSNTIVGFCNTASLIDMCAFVSYNGAPALNLNDLLLDSTPYTLIDAMDINEAGWIVGTAVSGPVDQPTGVYAYWASPITVSPPPHGPIRGWPPGPIWVWGFGGWLPYPGIYPPWLSGNHVVPSPMLRLSSSISRRPISGKGPSYLQKMLAAHRARIFRGKKRKA
jgi:hypothetical protein